ncbi:hypothetical protein CBF23_013625 [Marinomonas agarivorans]|nr:hypothetical protein CBF23_013625 [Marinomonas agarivorans]
MKRLFIFDMDGTILPDSTGLIELAKELGTVEQLLEFEKCFSERKLNTLEFTNLISEMWGKIDPETSFQAFKKSKKLNDISKCLREIKDRDGISCLITMSQDIFANHFLSFGFNYVFSTNYPPNTKLNPRILSPKDKPLIAKDICQKYGIDFFDSVAFGDSLSDEPLFNELTETVAVNASLALQEISKYSYTGNSMLEAYNLVKL